ncbi:MAG: TonB-dependent receptor [Allosphingosinicella sp.]
MAFPAPALAYEADAQPPAPDPDVEAQQANQALATAQVDAPAAAEGGVVVVTARRRNETLQDVPGAVTAVGGEALETLAVTDLRALSGRVPNFSVEQATTSSSASQIFLRGIGIDNTGFNTDPNVGVYIDDIFVGRLIGSMVSSVDLERVEVLRGPQGTLYGRNSTAGAVKYVTRRPDLNDTYGRLVATVGNFNRRTLRGTVNVPLIPGELAVMFNAQSHNEDGYITLLDAAGNDTGHRANARDVLDARVSLLWEPTEDLSIYLTGDLTRNRSGLQSLTPTNCGALGTRPGITANGTVGQISAGQFERCPLFYSDPFRSFIGPFPYDDPRFDSRGASASISYDLGFATLRSITGARGFNDVFASPLFAKPAPNVQVNLRNELQQSAFQQELQLASSGDGWLGYIAGLFYYHEDIRSIYQSQVGTTATVPYINDDRQLTDAYAAYGEIYIRPVQGLEVTLGGRMSWDEKQVDRLLFASPTATTPSITYSDDITESHFTPRLGISYDTGPILVYATYSEGYRAPGWANANPANLVGMQLEFGIETESSYEVGVRSQWFDRMLTLNASAFSAEYNNLGATLTAGGQTIVVTSDARIQGLELEGSLRPMQGLNIFGNLALLEDEYINPPQGQPYAMRLKHAPRTTWLLGADYQTAIGGLPGTFFIGGDVNYTASAFRNVANTIDQQSDSYTLVTARMGYRAEGDRWSLTLGGTNLTDEVYWLLGTQNQARSYQSPRRVFLTAEVRF